MKEIELVDFESYYKERLDTIFSKLKKAVKKQIGEIKENLIEVKVCMDHFLEKGKENLDEKSLKSLNFFSDRIKKEIDTIEVPDEEIAYNNINNLLGSIKKLFINIQDIAKKSVPKFKMKTQSEIKELEYITRKLGTKQKKLDEFLRKNYNELREAEKLLEKIDKLKSLKNNIENAKTDLDNFQKEVNGKEEDQNNLIENLRVIEKDELFMQLDMEEKELIKLRMEINDQFGFKKALKKLRFEMEKNAIHISNIDQDFIRDFLKKPISTLLKEPANLPKFTSLLVQLRHALEENKLNLKTETKDKTIEQISMIFEQKKINNDLDQYREMRAKIKAIQAKVMEAGLAARREDVKNQISVNTAKIEHLKSDLDRKNKDYMKIFSLCFQ
ncbi:MAG: hypothetical protein ACFFKA_09015 [Candidatus Thorarchaeota archaeon]